MRTDDLLALEQSAESPPGAVGATGCPHRYQRGGIHPFPGPMLRVDSNVNRSCTAEAQLSSLIRDGSFFLFSESTVIFKEERHENNQGI